MDLRRLLRQLIIVEISLLVVSIAVELILERFLPPLLRAWIDQHTDRIRVIDLVLILLGLPLLAALIAAWVGLWRLWRPARWIYLWTVAGGLLLEALAGPWVYSGPGAALATLQSLNSGVILALVFLTPLAAEFERPVAAPARGGFDVNMPPSGPPDAGDRT